MLPSRKSFDNDERLSNGQNVMLNKTKKTGKVYRCNHAMKEKVNNLQSDRTALGRDSRSIDTSVGVYQRKVEENLSPS